MMKLVAEFSVGNGQYYWYQRITPLVIVGRKLTVADVIASGDVHGNVSGGNMALVGFPYVGGN